MDLGIWGKGLSTSSTRGRNQGRMEARPRVLEGGVDRNQEVRPWRRV